jgi:hypothetical protein
VLTLIQDNSKVGRTDYALASLKLPPPPKRNQRVSNAVECRRLLDTDSEPTFRLFAEEFIYVPDCKFFVPTRAL